MVSHTGRLEPAERERPEKGGRLFAALVRSLFGRRALVRLAVVLAGFLHVGKGRRGEVAEQVLKAALVRVADCLFRVRVRVKRGENAYGNGLRCLYCFDQGNYLLIHGLLPFRAKWRKRQKAHTDVL